jgi:hypothetical protein
MQRRQHPDPDPDPDPIGGELALVQTDVTAQVTAALTDIRLFSRPVSSRAQGSAALPQATEGEEAKQAAGDPIGDGGGGSFLIKLTRFAC